MVRRLCLSRERKEGNWMGDYMGMRRVRIGDRGSEEVVRLVLVIISAIKERLMTFE